MLTNLELLAGSASTSHYQELEYFFDIGFDH
jgi:hypothetical protein